MPLKFDKYAQKGNQFLNELTEELGVNKEKAGKVLRAFFKALRNHLTLAENFQLLSQLPMALKGIYVDAWMPTHQQEVSRKKNDFIFEFLQNQNSKTLGSVSEVRESEKIIIAIFKTLKKYISQGEFEDMEAVLPRQLKELVKESIYNQKVTIRLVPQK